MPKGSITVKKPKPKTLAERVLVHMRTKHAIEFPSRPVNHKQEEYTPSLPPDITTVTNVQLGRLQSEFASYADYVQGVLALAEIDHLESVDVEKTEEAKTRLSLHEGTLQEKADEAHLDPVATRRRQESLEAKARRTFLRNRLDQLERAMKVISREQSRRETENARRY